MTCPSVMNYIFCISVCFIINSYLNVQSRHTQVVLQKFIYKLQFNSYSLISHDFWINIINKRLIDREVRIHILSGGNVTCKIPAKGLISDRKLKKYKIKIGSSMCMSHHKHAERLFSFTKPKKCRQNIQNGAAFLSVIVFRQFCNIRTVFTHQV